MTATGFLYLAEPLLGRDRHAVLGLDGAAARQLWAVPFAALILSFPSGRVVGGWTGRSSGASSSAPGCCSSCGCCSWRSPRGRRTSFLISAQPGLDDAIDTFQRAWNGTLAAALGIVGLTRWLRAAPALRRLLLPTLAGLRRGADPRRADPLPGGRGRVHPREPEITSVVLVSVPLAYLFGLLRTHVRARRGRGPRPRAPAGPGRAAAARAARPSAARPVAGARLLAAGFESYIDADGAARRAARSGLRTRRDADRPGRRARRGARPRRGARLRSRSCSRSSPRRPTSRSSANACTRSSSRASRSCRLAGAARRGG